MSINRTAEYRQMLDEQFDPAVSRAHRGESAIEQGVYCGGQIVTIYTTQQRHWLKIGRMCKRCLAFWMDRVYWGIRPEDMEGIMGREMGLSETLQQGEEVELNDGGMSGGEP